MTSSLTHEAFAKQLNTTFKIRLDDSDYIEAELTEVSEHLVSANQERFSIVLRGPNDKFLGQGMRHFEHDELNSFDLFLVPMGRDEQGTYYEAVFNRLRSKQDSPTE